MFSAVAPGSVVLRDCSSTRRSASKPVAGVVSASARTSITRSVAGSARRYFRAITRAWSISRPCLVRAPIHAEVSRISTWSRVEPGAAPQRNSATASSSRAMHSSCSSSESGC